MNLDCLTSNYYGQFRIVRTSDGADLIFGPARIYDMNLIRFYTLNASDTTFFDYQARSANAGNDSMLYVHFFPKTDIAYMRLSNGDIDTFEISHRSFDTRCCGTITEITNFRYNDSLDIPADQGIQILKK